MVGSERDSGSTHRRTGEVKELKDPVQEKLPDQDTLTHIAWLTDRVRKCKQVFLFHKSSGICHVMTAPLKITVGYSQLDKNPAAFQNPAVIWNKFQLESVPNHSWILKYCWIFI